MNLQKCYTSDSFMQRLSDKSCDGWTDSGKIAKVCCADYEEKGNGCIACLKGYTSDIGQNCRPCSKNLYGERCRHTCTCYGYEICDHIEGCVESLSTTAASANASSHDRTLTWTTRTATDYVYDDKSYKWTTIKGADSGNDITSSHSEVNTNRESTGCSVQGLLSREIIVYSTLSVIVIVFGICLCLVFLKYKTLTRKEIVTINQTQNSAIPQQIQTIEIADRLYDIINEEDILDDQRIQQMQMQMSSNYLDVIHDSNTRESCERKSLESHHDPCQLLSTAQTQNIENNSKVDGYSLISGESTASSDEYDQDSIQDYINPYQPMIEITPPEEKKYLTIPTAISKDATTNV